MKATGIVRHIDELGRIVVPKEMRTKMDILCGDPVEIFVEDDKIILRKYAPNCLFCGSAENLSEFKDRKICSECLAELRAK
ncbi:MAG: AbrB/MazE/SpoVT family DNA-binding domain-containing protein [Clostridia bacterium]|nr:AbrB/MazE/SpoVT family DNA-binding domain-containing protein [Clostridia bacterium]